jgi:hypothetical protein
VPGTTGDDERLQRMAADIKDVVVKGLAKDTWVQGC